MDWNTIQQLIRIIMQVVAGMLVGRGLMTEDMAATMTGGILSLSQVVWWFFWNRKLATVSTSPSQ